ncbi:MAG: Ig-like domain-containing protein [Steroidobacteraceae bacterium]
MIDFAAYRSSMKSALARRSLGMALLLCLTGCIAACGGSSRAISVIGPAAPQLTSISVGPPDTTLNIGLTEQFAATGIYSDGSRKDISALVTWTSGAANVATISNAGGSSGLATAVAAGATTITAALGSVFGTTTLTVSAATLVSIGVTPATPSIARGTQQQFAATGVYSDFSTQNLTAAVTWVSTAPSVASISTAAPTIGLASAASAGTTTITASLGAVSGSTTLTVTTATLVSIAITPSNATIAKGTDEVLAAIGTFSDNSTQNITGVVVWNSSAPAVASVASAAGSHEIASALMQGAATLTAAFGGVSGSTGLTVSAATLVSIAVAPLNSSVAKGTHEPFTATGTFTDNSTQNITTLVTWSSSAAAVASISNAATFNGIATALGLGTTTITATLGGVSASTPLTVSAATLVSIGVTPANPSIAKGTTLQFTAIGVYTDNSTQNLTAVATWNSATATVATISNAAGSNGLANAATPGTTLVTATFGGITSPSVTLTVTPATLVRIAVTAPSLSVAAGTPVQFTATGTYSDASTQILTTAVTWNSGTTTVATISNAPGSNGLASTASAGNTLITAALGSVTSPAVTLTVTPATLVSIAVTPVSASIAAGTAQQFVATGTYTDGSMQVITTAVTWNSGTTTVATISNTPGSNGLATSAAVGTSAITATDPTTGINSAPVTLTVTAATLVSILVTPANPVIGVLNTEQFIATGTYTDGSMQTLTTTATWTSGTPATATIGNSPGTNGLATGLTLGTTLITAALGGITSNAVTLTVAGALAYAVNITTGNVSQFAIAAAGSPVPGSLVPLTNPTIAAGANPFSLAVDPSNQYLYVANYTKPGTVAPGSISQYTIGADGSLTPMTNPTVATLLGPNSIAVNPKGPYVYVADYNSSAVSQYDIGAGGALTPMTVPFVTAGAGLVPASIAVTPAGTYAYAADNDTAGVVYQYSISQTNGSLTPLTPQPSVSAGKDPQWVAVDPSGQYVYVANTGDGSISQYIINQATGVLTPMTPATVLSGASPLFIAVDAKGQNAYVVNQGDSTVWQFTITGGALAYASTVTVGTGPSSIAIDPTGQFAYVTNRASATGTISQFAIQPNGSLTPLANPTVTVGPNPATIITLR